MDRLVKSIFQWFLPSLFIYLSTTIILGIYKTPIKTSRVLAAEDSTLSQEQIVSFFPTTSPTITPTSSPTPNPNPTSTPTPSNSPTVTPTIKPQTKTSIVTQAQVSTPTQIVAQVITSDISSYLLSAVNNYRKSQGLSEVTSNQQTCDFAKKRAQELTSNFSHDGFQNNPYPSYSKVTENISMNPDYKQVVPMWIASSGHAENMRADTPFVCIQSSGNYYAYEGWKP